MILILRFMFLRNSPLFRTSCLVSLVLCLWDFAKQLESKFSRIDEKYSQLGSATATVIGDSSVNISQDSLNVSYDVCNPFFSAPAPVAVLTRHDPDKASYASQRGDLEIPMGWVVAGGPLSSGASLPQTCFRDLEGTISCFDRSGLDLPESFQNSLRSIPVVSVEYNFAIAGRTVVDSLASSHSRVCSSKDPIPGPSQGRGSVLGVLQEIVGVTSSSLPLGASGLLSRNGVGSLVSQFGVLFGVLGVPLSASSALFCPSSSGVASFAPPVTFFFLLAPLSRPLLFSSSLWRRFSSSGHLCHSSCHLSVSLCFFYGSPVASLPLVVSVGPPIASLSHPISAWLSYVVSSSLPVAFSCPFSSVASWPLPGVSSCSPSTVTS